MQQTKKFATINEFYQFVNAIFSGKWTNSARVRQRDANCEKKKIKKIYKYIIAIENAFHFVESDESSGRSLKIKEVNICVCS